MKRVIAVVAATVVYVGVLSALEWKAYTAANTPDGQVYVTELGASSDLNDVRLVAMETSNTKTR